MDSQISIKIFEKLFGMTVKYVNLWGDDLSTTDFKVDKTGKVCASAKVRTRMRAHTSTG